MKKIIALMICALMLLSACGGTSANSGTAQKPVLVMGTNAEFPPFEFIGETGLVENYDGIDVAIAMQIAEDHGYTLEISNMEFDGLLAALSQGKIDFIAAGMSVTDERKENADASVEYYLAAQNIIVMGDDDSVTSGADLTDKTIGVQEGTTGDIICSDDMGLDVTRYKKGADAVMALKKGDVDAVVIDTAPAASFVKKNSDLKLITDDEFFGEEAYAIWVKKGNTELLDRINQTLTKMLNDGSIDKLSVEYSE